MDSADPKGAEMLLTQCYILPYHRSKQGVSNLGTELYNRPLATAYFSSPPEPLAA